MNSNQNKNEQLGMSHGSASHKLRKLILFDCIKKLQLNRCFRCDKYIDNIDDLSIEHKIAWLNSENPLKYFFDLENIAFSHLKCNSGFTTRNISQTERQNISKRFSGEQNTNSKLKEKDINRIKFLLRIGYSLRKIAKMYNVEHTTILDIKQKKTWRNQEIP